MYFELENDDMESLKRCSLFISLIFILKCFTKRYISQPGIRMVPTLLTAIFNRATECNYSNLEFQLFICETLSKFDWLESAN